MKTYTCIALLTFLTILPIKELEQKKHETDAAIALAFLGTGAKLKFTTVEPEEPKSKKAKIVLECSECPKKFEHPSRLKTHMYKHFPETKPCACTQAGCNLRFTDKTHLNIHLQSHARRAASASNIAQQKAPKPFSIAVLLGEQIAKTHK